MSTAANNPITPNTSTFSKVFSNFKCIKYIITIPPFTQAISNAITTDHQARSMDVTEIVTVVKSNNMISILP